ncbi:ABC transporter permease [Microvirga terricola]|uniref:ABC transporter permease subunit n=1 Tax=Microvirga terricola TaxID=2719797 RepID=A0ABX0VB66_9HYPH|nr:ABC transporter permease subunit [Microvirga terricola]NIX77095.1 ABC transporter permease subunit [Microvirga terricola]
MITRPILDAARRPLGFGRIDLRPNLYDLVALAIVVGVGVAVIHGAREMRAPLMQLDITPVSLDPSLLPEYALRTTLRMFAAMGASLVFTFMVATLAAKSRRAELVIIPALDILQSVPVLGFLTFTVVFFLGLFPGSQMGAELAAIFAIFTAQAWNMAFSFYQSLRTVPRDLDEVARHFRLSPWLRFWRLEAPFATPGLVWNAMMSMSGSWFFVVASEAISVGDTKILLPGIGAWLALAIEHKDLKAIALAVFAIGVVILLYDQLVFRPIVAWADKFRAEQTAAQQRPRSWVYDLVRRTHLIRRLALPVSWLFEIVSEWIDRIKMPEQSSRLLKPSPETERTIDILWIALVLAATGYMLWLIIDYVSATLSFDDLRQAVTAGGLTLSRVIILIALASLIWVPIGVWIGPRPAVAQRVQPVAQFLAAFPANVLFPFVVVLIVTFKLNPNIWLSPLMILGTQWYILFNVIAGASAFPTDLREVSTIFRVRHWNWWRRVMLPGIFPYFVTGALTASGGSWNASIVAEVASWGDVKLHAAGLGAYIADATDAGDFPRVVLGVAVMSMFVVALNQLLWRPLYRFAEQRMRLN